MGGFFSKRKNEKHLSDAEAYHQLYGTSSGGTKKSQKNKSQKRRTQKSKSQKRRTQKNKSQKRRTQKRRTQKKR